MLNPKVLVGVVTSSVKDYCIDAFIKQLLGFNYNNHKVVVVDNSTDKNHIKKFLRHRISVVHHDISKVTWSVGLMQCQNILRDIAIKSYCDYLFLLESDCFTTKNIIAWSVGNKDPVCTYTYPVWPTKHKAPTYCLQFTHVFKNRAGSTPHFNTSMLPYNVTVPSEKKLIYSFKIGDEGYLSHTGLGCTFIRSDVLEMIPFRVDPNNDRAIGAMTFSDSFFFADCLASGVPVYFDNRIQLKHIKNWTMTHYDENDFKNMVVLERERLSQYNEWLPRLKRALDDPELTDVQKYDIWKRIIDATSTMATLQTNINNFEMILENQKKQKAAQKIIKPSKKSNVIKTL